MSAVIEAPLEMVEAVADLRLPPKADRRLQDLMDRNTNGGLTQKNESNWKRSWSLASQWPLFDPRPCKIRRKAPGFSHGDIRRPLYFVLRWLIR